MLHHVAELNNGKIHRDDEAADERPEHDDHQWLTEARQCADFFVNLTIAERCDVDQHGVQCTGLLCDGNRLNDLSRKAARCAHGCGEPFAAPQAGGDVDGGAIEPGVAGGVG